MCGFIWLCVAECGACGAAVCRCVRLCVWWMCVVDVCGGCVWCECGGCVVAMMDVCCGVC
jgi:hypothetical protein